MRLKTPKVTAQTSEAGLYFIADAYATAGAHHIEGSLHIIAWELYSATNACNDSNFRYPIVKRNLERSRS